MYKDSDSPAKDFEKKPLPGTTASKPPAPKTPHAKPRGEGESDEAYNKRTANFAKSQERLKSVGITGGVNNASKEQLSAFNKQYGRDPSGLKPKDTTKPDMSAENPSKSKTQPSKGSEKFDIKKDKNNFGASAGKSLPSVTSPGKKPTSMVAMKASEKALSSAPMNARRARRKKRLMRKTSMQGGTL
jgi:hypothetical protein